jgi:branched-chain amino acid transport system ATP-binding protein
VVPNHGTIKLFGEDITTVPPYKRAKHGLTRTYQTPQLFEDMTVLETVMVGAHLTGRSSFWSALVRAPFLRQEEAAMEVCARQALKRVGLSESVFRREALVLPYGYQRRVEIARALAMSPRVLLLDEPAAGLNAIETGEIAELIRDLAGDGMIIVLVEHDMSMVMEISKKIVVMNFGTKIADGTPAAIQTNQDVIDAYLGTSQGEHEHA